MKKILVICPSRERPERCNEMYDSFMDTSTVSDLIVVVDNNDPTISKYKMSKAVQHPQTITETYNKFWRINKDKYDYFMCMNDDFIFHTEGWDIALTQAIRDMGGFGIAYPKNGMNEQLPMTSVISNNILKCLGYLQLPTLVHLCGDLVWRDFGRAINKLVYCQDVYIEHKHFMNLKAEKDSTYEKGNSKQRYKEDNQAYREWTKYELQRGVEVVLSCMRETCRI